MADICHECANPSWTGKTIEAPALPSGGEGGTSNFNALENRPKYDGMRMTGNTDIPNTARDVERLDGDISDIQELIPETASTENQLADKDFVNSSVATNTANFVGTYDSLEELEAVENPSNNDYGFVISTDEYGNTVYNRYKYVASVESWEFEYALNNSSFTAAQWAAINSGITEGNVEKLNAILEITSIGNGLVLENNGQLRQKLYTETGDNTDAPMNQKAASDAIDAVYGHARVLTEADYNYDRGNTGENNCIAPWLLPDGQYQIASGVKAIKDESYAPSTDTVFNKTSFTIFRWTDGMYAGFVAALFYHAGTVGGGPGLANNSMIHVVWSRQGVLQVPETSEVGWLLTGANVVDNLTTGYAQRPLSAKQGMVLAGRIGDPANLNTTAKTNTVAAINEVAGQKGQARELTADDYNWNSTTQTTTNPNSIALWLLPPGMYYTKSTMITCWSRTTSTNSPIVAIVGETTGTQSPIIVFEDLHAQPYFLKINKTNGTQATRTEFVLQSDIEDNLTSYFASRPLSANQGRILKDLADGKQDELTAGNGIEIDNQSVISIANISAEDWSDLWQ